ncbi:MAG: Allergen V5/Tpx related [Actinomycetia bacterium]|nr:Allergen V5/Tpx related [Actinomycetes bacterium]
MFKHVLAVIAALVLILPAAALGGSTRAETSLLREMNRVRAEHGLGRLTGDTRLIRAARSHSREMLGANVFQHGAFGSRMAQFDVTGKLAGENLAWGTGVKGTARGIVLAWLASPEHRANLLRPSFTRVGISDLVGSFRGHSGAHVVTADFAG